MKRKRGASIEVGTEGSDTAFQQSGRREGHQIVVRYWNVRVGRDEHTEAPGGTLVHDALLAEVAGQAGPLAATRAH